MWTTAVKGNKQIHKHTNLSSVTMSPLCTYTLYISVYVCLSVCLRHCVWVSLCVFSGGLKCFQRQHPASQHAVSRNPTPPLSKHQQPHHTLARTQANKLQCSKPERLQRTSQSWLKKKLQNAIFLNNIKTTTHMGRIICLGLSKPPSVYVGFWWCYGCFWGVRRLQQRALPSHSNNNNFQASVRNANI